MTADSGRSGPAERAAGSPGYAGAPVLLRAPLWVDVLDALCLLFAVMSLCVWLFGGHREQVFGLRVSFRSSPRLLLLAAAIGAGRHLMFPRLRLHSRLKAAARSARQSRPLRAAAAPFFGTRPAVLAAGYFAAITIGFIPSMVSFRVSNNELVNLTARWDADWYLQVARDGYSWTGNSASMQTVAFFPAVPLGMHLGAFFAGGQLVNGGLVVSLVAFFAALVYLYKLTAPLTGDGAARATAWLIAAYPFSIYFSAPYTEALFLLGCVAVFHHVGKGEWRAGAAWGFLVGLTRPNGFMLVAPIGALVLQRAAARRSIKAGECLATVAPLLGLMVFAGFLYVRVGDPLAWARAQAAWGRGYGGLAATLAGVASRTSDVSAGLYRYSIIQPFDLLHTCAVVAAAVSIWPTFRRFGAPLAIFTLANLLPALVSGGTMSAGRMTSVLFPMFMCAGSALPEKYLPGVVAACCVMQGLVAALFFSWRPVY